MKASSDDGRAAVETGLRELVSTLKAAPQVRRFAEAERRARTDEDLLRLQKAVRAKSDDFRRAERDGKVQQKDIDAFRGAQAELQRHPVLREFMAAREGVTLLLQDVNRVITDIVGMDVGRTVGPASGCC